METLCVPGQEGNVDAVKLEGGRNRADHIRKIVDGGIAVMGHVGLTPQAIRCVRTDLLSWRRTSKISDLILSYLLQL